MSGCSSFAQTLRKGSSNTTCPLCRALVEETAAAKPSRVGTAAEDGGIPRVVLIGAIGAASALALFGLVLFFLRGRAGRGRRGSDEEPPKP